MDLQNMTTHARNLERERDEAREQLKAMREALSGRTVSCSSCNQAAVEIQAMREAIKEASDSLHKCSRVIGAPKTYEWADEDVCDAAYNSAQTTLAKLQLFK
jgi:cell division septum initiation protein DivIVA